MFVLINDLKIHYKVKGSGVPIIALHGWGRSLTDFMQLQNTLATKFTVYIVDLPGFGLSTTPATVWGSKDYAFCVQYFIEKLGIKAPILLGHSFGGKVLLYLVGQHLVVPTKMVLIGSAGIRLRRSWHVWLRICQAKLLKFCGNLPLVKKFFGSKIALYRQRFGSRDYRMAQGIMRKILVKALQENVTFLQEIHVPTLLIWGAQDCETSLVAGKIMHHGIVNSRLAVIAHGGHFVLQDNWEQVKKELIEFLG